MPANFGDLDDDDSAAQPTSRVSRQQAAPVAGDVFDNRYELVRILGKGGAGVVWEARVKDPKVAEKTADATVAIKLVAIPSRTRAVRAEREISIGLDLAGPHFVRVFDAGIVPPYAYVAMERLEGEDLATRLDRLGKLSIDESLAMGEQLARGMSAAHRLGLVHRDLKPTNVFLVRLSESITVVKVLDFGVAKRLGVESRVTASDTLLGAPQYAAPEQIQNARKVDTRADVWSMGAIMYRCLLGRRPFDGVGGALLATVMATPHAAPTTLDPSMPAQLDAVFARGLAKRPDERFSTANELMDAIVAAFGRR